METSLTNQNHVDRAEPEYTKKIGNGCEGLIMRIKISVQNGKVPTDDYMTMITMHEKKKTDSHHGQRQHMESSDDECFTMHCVPTKYSYH